MIRKCPRNQNKSLQIDRVGARRVGGYVARLQPDSGRRLNQSQHNPEGSTFSLETLILESELQLVIGLP